MINNKSYYITPKNYMPLLKLSMYRIFHCQKEYEERVPTFTGAIYESIQQSIAQATTQLETQFQTDRLERAIQQQYYIQNPFTSPYTTI